MLGVHIEFQRVQTWLFAVPRLRAMVGANTMLGETLRVKLPELARRGSNWQLASLTGFYPAADPGDPLKAEDDPSADAREGILARDGGHFEAQFASGAEEFADAAAELLGRELPGLRFRISIDKVERHKHRAHLLNELPVLAPCEWMGRGLASMIVRQGDDQATVSIDVARRHEAATRAEHHKSHDLASLLSAKTKLSTLQRAQELRELVDSGYLALIYADGNGVGESSARRTDEKLARFFHRNRVLLRRALHKAIDTVCEGKKNVAPLVLLMLGGDDLLVVCRAEEALPFVVSLCEELARLQSGDGGDFKLTLGVGVVIAKHTIPIHRLHEVAEELVISAKRRFRGLDEARSVVDWAVYTTTWVDEPEDVRRRDWVCGQGQDRRVLSQRPIDVLGEGLDSLQGLVRGAEMLKGAPRSQLRYLVDQLPRGRKLSELAYAELSKKARDRLKAAGVDRIWQRASDGDPWTTVLLDLVEITEIGRLGTRNETSQAGQEVTHA